MLSVTWQILANFLYLDSVIILKFFADVGSWTEVTKSKVHSLIALVSF